jgi:hypothetical protein
MRGLPASNDVGPGTRLGAVDVDTSFGELAAEARAEALLHAHTGWLLNGATVNLPITVEDGDR